MIGSKRLCGLLTVLNPSFSVSSTYLVVVPSLNALVYSTVSNLPSNCILVAMFPIVFNRYLTSFPFLNSSVCPVRKANLFSSKTPASNALLMLSVISFFQPPPYFFFFFFFIFFFFIFFLKLRDKDLSERVLCRTLLFLLPIRD